MACAKCCTTSERPANSVGKSLWPSESISAVSLTPVAASIKQSLVDVSPSTLMRLKLRSASFLVRTGIRWGATFALQATNASMVAISGFIMPEPLAIPVMTTSPVDRVTRRLTSLATVSVVMMAVAAASQPSGFSSTVDFCAACCNSGTFKRSPITPVEKGCTWVASTPAN